jgi:hypothetical protein
MEKTGNCQRRFQKNKGLSFLNPKSVTKNLQNAKKSSTIPEFSPVEPTDHRSLECQAFSVTIPESFCAHGAARMRFVRQIVRV